jgi:ribonuclease III
MIDHVFRDPHLLTAALTHASWAHEHGGQDYERLEHLGDAVLQLSVTTLLHERLASSAEGDLTHLRQRLVNGPSLAELARKLGLDAHVRLGAGAEAGGTRASPSVLSDVVEAVIGAVYLDAGFDAAHALAAKWLEEPLRALTDMGMDEARHPKSLLQERVQRDIGSTPTYVTTEQRGPAHAPWFSVEVHLDARSIGAGAGSTVREAERRAAADALTRRGWVAP